MGRYSLITSNIHSDEEFKALSAKGQLLYFKLITHPYGNKAGFFHLDVEYTAKFMMRCSVPALKALLKTDTGLWKYDESTDVILLPNYLKYNKVAGCKTLKGMEHDLEQLPKTRLCVDFIYKLNELTAGDGIGYIPKGMVETARALCKDASSVRDIKVSKILSLY